MTTARARLISPSAATPRTRAVLDQQIFDRGFDDRQIFRLTQRRLHRRAIELAVGLGARTAHRRSLGAIEHAKLDAGGVGDAAHQSIERVDLAHQLALAKPADRRIAGHFADLSRGSG